jgi:hypothetical protein
MMDKRFEFSDAALPELGSYPSKDMSPQPRPRSG